MNLRAIAFALPLACALPACSFMGLDEFDLLPCNVPGAERSPCDELNAKRSGDECEEYVCHVSGFGCVLKPRDRDDDHYADDIACAGRKDLGALDCDDGNDQRNDGFDEICDGIDNNCDDWIDENALPEEAAASFSDSIEDSLVHMSLSPADEDTLYFALTYPASPTPRPRNELLTLVGDDRLDPKQIDFGTKCKTTNNREFGCDFGLLEIAAAASNAMFAAGINYGGCGSGQLWVGGSRTRDLPVLGVNAEGSSLAIDIDGKTGCTALTEWTSCSGVSRPALAALPELGSAPAQALIVWNAPLDAQECPRYRAGDENDDPSAVAAVGVLLDGKRLVATTDDQDRCGPGRACSELLGDGATGGPAAVIAWPGSGSDGGYFVAFAAGESVELRFVPRLKGAASPLREGLAEGSIATLSAGHATLALDGSSRDAPRGLGVAYRIESSDGQAVAFAPLQFDRGAEPALWASSTPIEFETTEPIISGPTLTYARNGFAENADARKTGGWLVTWIEGAKDGTRRLMAARIAQKETHRLGLPIALERGTLTWPFAYSKHSDGQRDEVHYGFIENADLRLGRLSCPPAIP